MFTHTHRQCWHNVYIDVVFEVALGYSTERAEKHIADDPRTITLDLRQQRGTGSLGDLDRLAYDPNIVSCSAVIQNK